MIPCFRVQEVVDPKYDPNRDSRSLRQQQQLFAGTASTASDSRGERSRSAPAGSPKPNSNSRFPFSLSKRSSKASIALPGGKRSKGGKDGQNGDGNGGPPPSGPHRLWHEETVRLYLRVLQESAEPEILEAAAAAIQNLAACPFEGSAQVNKKNVSQP